MEEHRDLQKLVRKSSGKSKLQSKEIATKREIKQASGNIVRLESQKRSGYEQYVLGKISKEKFLELWITRKILTRNLRSNEKGGQTMKEKIYDARTGMEYVLVGDYYLPALKLPRTRPIGRWGMLHKAYLKLRKPAYYQSLLLSGKLDTVLANVEEQAAERYKVLIEQMSQREKTSEKLKEENQMEWVRRMRNLENRAAEIVKAELIYTFERR